MYPNIAKELVINRITLSKLAEKIGMAKTTLYDKYNGRSEFTLPEAFTIQEALNSKMCIDDLFEKVKEEEEAV